MMLLSWLISCAPKTPPAALVEAPTIALGDAAEPVRLKGVCEPRAAVIQEQMLIIGDAGISAKRVSIQPNGRKASPQRWPQGLSLLDVSGATTLNGATYWVGSHSLGKGPRSLLLRVEGEQAQSLSLRPDGDLSAWTAALESTPSCPDCSLPPEFLTAGGNKGGLRIGALAGASERLWIGLQSPLTTDGRALVMVLDDKRSLATGSASFQDAWALDLGQRGVLAMEYAADLDAFLLVAGPPGRKSQEAEPYLLVAWRPGAEPVVLGPAPKVKGGVPSALVLETGKNTAPNTQSLWLLYDEGARYRRKYDKWNRPGGQKCSTIGKAAGATMIQIPLSSQAPLSHQDGEQP